MSSELEELVTQFVVMCNDKASVAVAKSVTYGERLSVVITFVLEVRGGNITMRAKLCSR